MADELIATFGKSAGRQLRELAHFLGDPADREVIEIVAEAVEAKPGLRLLPIWREGWLAGAIAIAAIPFAGDSPGTPPAPCPRRSPRGSAPAGRPRSVPGQPPPFGIRKCPVAWAKSRARLSCQASTWTLA